MELSKDQITKILANFKEILMKKLDEDLEWAEDLLVECSSKAESIDELCKCVSSYYDEQIHYWSMMDSSRYSTEEIESLESEKKVRQEILDSLSRVIKQVLGDTNF